jgi:putative ABC transport system permease protein
LKKICIQIFADYSGYFPFYVPGSTFLKMFALGAIDYAVVGVFQIHKVKKIPMGEALKNVE